MSMTFIGSGVDQLQIGNKTPTFNIAGTYITTGSVASDQTQYIQTGAWQLMDTGSVGGVRIIELNNLNMDNSGNTNVTASIIVVTTDVAGTKPICYLYSSNPIPSRISWSGSIQPYAQAYGTSSTLSYTLIPL